MSSVSEQRVDCVWNVMAQAQKPDFVFRRNERVHLNRQGRQLSRLLAAEVCAPAVVMLDTPRSEVVWRVLATHSIRQFPFHFPSRSSLCAMTFQLDSNNTNPPWKAAKLLISGGFEDPLREQPPWNQDQNRTPPVQSNSRTTQDSKTETNRIHLKKHQKKPT